jgi:hypothetical protein
MLNLGSPRPPVLVVPDGLLERHEEASHPSSTIHGPRLLQNLLCRDKVVNLRAEAGAGVEAEGVLIDESLEDQARVANPGKLA